MATTQTYRLESDGVVRDEFGEAYGSQEGEFGAALVGEFIITASTAYDVAKRVFAGETVMI